jgi:hypothetical protein
MEILVSRSATIAAVLAWVATAACSAPRCGLEVCDIRQPACQQRVAEAAACLHEAPLAQVPVRVISSAQYQAERRADTVDAAVFHRLAVALSLFDLAPADLSPDGAIAATSWAAAYYSHDRRDVTIIDDGTSLDSGWHVTLLVHEFTHALQFQRGALPSKADSTDRMLAAAAAIEGEAVMVEDLAELALFGANSEDVPWPRVYRDWQTRARAEMLRASAPFLVADQWFMYPFGSAVVHGALDAGGWPAVEALVAAPPASARQVQAGFGSAEPAAGPWLESLDEVAVPDLPASFQHLTLDQLGSWVLESYLARLHIDARDIEPVRFLRGDRFSVHYEAQSDALVVTWRLRFASATLAGEMQRLVAPRLRWSARVFQVDRDLIVAASNLPAWVSGLEQLTFKPAPPDPRLAPVMFPAPLGCPPRQSVR